MKKTIIFGAGQGARMIFHILNKSEYEITAFADNNADFDGFKIYALPVINAKEAVEQNPEVIYISMLNAGAAEEVAIQLRKLGFNGDIETILEHRKQFDIRAATLNLISREITERNIPGSLAELGVYQGKFAAVMNANFPNRNIYLFDTFEGFDSRDVLIEKSQCFSSAKSGKFSDTSIKKVYRQLPYPEKAIFKQGYFPDSAEDLKEQFALVSLDADLYKPMYEGLKFFYPNMTKGGYIIMHDYNNLQFKGAGEAIRQFCKEQNICLVPLCDLHGSAVIIKG